MQKHYSANILLVSLLLLIAILTVLFLGKDQRFNYDKSNQYFYKKYLTFRLKLTDIIPQSPAELCRKKQRETIIEEYQGLQYHFNCVRQSLFIQPKLTKYIQTDEIRNWLDIDYYQNEIIQIHSLADLPHSTESKPKIVQVLNEIDGALTQDFYGIIITDYYFDVKGKYKIYGTIYSSYNNQRTERNLTYKRAVIENLDKQYHRWEYIPRTKNLLSYETPF